ncbi:MAG: hypothetical protein IJS53_00595, partial [Clostridia bacterium]|nr:hypothetical protein [Clostridia bacterium]
VVCETVGQAASGASVREGMAVGDTPAQLGWLAGAFAGARRLRRVAVVHAGDCPAAWHTALGALSAYGCEEVVALGRGTAGMLAYAVGALHADGGLLCRAEGMLLVDENGLPLSGGASETVASAARRQDLPVPALTGGTVRAHTSLRGAYLDELAKAWHCAEGIHVSLNCKDRFLRAVAREALTRAGHAADAKAPLAIAVTEDAAKLLTAENALAPWQQWLLCARALRLRGEEVYDVRDLGLAGDGFLPPDGSEACRRQQRLFRDGVAQLLLLLALFSAESPADALRALPALSRAEAEVPCPGGEKGRVMEALLADASPRPQGGLEAVRHGARGVVRPDPLLPLMRVAVSARDAETAQELCGLLSDKVRRALEKKENHTICGPLTTGDASPIIEP